MEYASFINPDILLDDKVNEFNNNENRPQISFDIDLHKDDILLKENEEINIKKKIVNENQKTILDEKLGDILEKTSETVSNFLSDYKVKMLESKYELETNNTNLKEEDKSKIPHILNIHVMGLFNYLKDNDNIIYLGIFIVFISVLLYIFNIIR
ncbi:MAG: hypothetical protein CMG74_06920 [Candidatus Marinimicrobia bacterium]|nr:hypothetical protein [Candidatus Neomarinimicrobiota bacterium]|tara:strand:+ start:1480 stop:1941 length:462 start_codon:yes stop_codon:yes gene_type:complete